MDADEVNVLKPGYVAWSTFTTFLDTIRADGVPNYVDASVLKNMSGTVRSQLRLTLQFLGLTDRDGHTSETLSQLAKAEPEGRKQAMRDILKANYGFLFNPSDDFSLENSPPTKFSEKFASFNLNGDTRTKAEAFFLNAAKFSEIKVSKYITQNRGTRKRKSGTKPRVPIDQNVKKTNEDEKPPYHLGCGQPVDESLLNGQFGLLYKLQIERLPKNGEWTILQRDQFMKAYTAILDLVIRTKDNSRDEAENE